MRMVVKYRVFAKHTLGADETLLVLGIGYASVQIISLMLSATVFGLVSYARSKCRPYIASLGRCR
jgi:hypothetical protein